MYHLQTAFLSNKDELHVTKSKLLAQMDSAMGGRAAEELIFGADKVTAGAQSDFKVRRCNLYNTLRIIHLTSRKKSQSLLIISNESTNRSRMKGCFTTSFSLQNRCTCLESLR